MNYVFYVFVCFLDKIDRELRYNKIKPIVGYSVFVLMFFISLILIVGISKQYQRIETKRCIDELSKKVASHDKEALMNWASGKEVDYWKNSFLINLNNDSVQFLSKGPDKVVSTKDDIYGDIFPKQKMSYENVVSPQKVKKNFFQRSWEKVRSKF